MKRVKVAIIGAGIVGASISRVLSQYDNLEIHLIEKEADVGWGVSKANTGLIHGGFDDDPDKYPVRARLCVKGNRIWHKWVKELQIPHSWNGALVVAFSDNEMRTLKNLRERGIKNGVREMRIIYEEEMKNLENGINQNALGALWIPSAGQISPIPAVIAIVENSVTNGVKLHLETEVKGIKIKEEKVEGVKTNNGFIPADIVINASGLHADDISRMAGLDYFKIHPRKGEYWLFDSPGPQRTLFPTPTEKSKGVVVTSEISGHLMIGPNAKDLDDKEDVGNTKEGLEEVWNKAKNLWEKLPSRNKVMRTFAGNRPETENGDFIIRSEDIWGFVNVAGIRSPGLTSAPAIAHEVVNILEKMGVKLTKKKKWIGERKEIRHFFMMSKKEVNSLIEKNDAYGKIICRCNMVSEGDILEAIERMKFIGVKTPSIDSVKFRTKATTGVCQGSFCRPKIVKILAENYEIPEWNVTLKGSGSEIGVGDVKALLRGDKSE